MKRLINVPIMLIALMFALGCTAEPDPILFGVQECAHCRMTITERPFAAQLMTTKGRTHSFDAIECMVRYTRSSVASHDDVKLFRVADQIPPHDLIDATQATFVISESIPSPMGGNLSAYRNPDAASSRLDGLEGEILTWMELLQAYNNR